MNRAQREELAHAVERVAVRRLDRLELSETDSAAALETIREALAQLDYRPREFASVIEQVDQIVREATQHLPRSTQESAYEQCSV